MKPCYSIYMKQVEIIPEKRLSLKRIRLVSLIHNIPLKTLIEEIYPVDQIIHVYPERLKKKQLDISRPVFIQVNKGENIFHLREIQPYTTVYRKPLKALMGKLDIVDKILVLYPPLKSHSVR